ncbi:unnamed protein product, partial [Didymodactylos carnosus]
IMVSPDSLSRNVAIIATIFGAIALVLACVGVGTPNWQVTYTDPPNNTNVGSTTNFFYTCIININCLNNNQLNTTSDYYNRLRNSAGLSIVGILFLAFGTIMTLVMALTNFYYSHLSGPILLFLAALFMMAALAEGA